MKFTVKLAKVLGNPGGAMDLTFASSVASSGELKFELATTPPDFEAIPGTEFTLELTRSNDGVELNPAPEALGGKAARSRRAAGEGQ